MPGPTNAHGRCDAYVICATPRTGSSLLCGLLESTGVAGCPESYFRLPDEQSWAIRWGIVRSPEGAYTYADYVQAAIAAGSTENGVFAARLMWGTLGEVIDKLGTDSPDLAGRDVDLLSRVFGDVRFVFLRRDHVLGQAVSWLRAEQTNTWFENDQFPREQPEHEPSFDLDRISELVDLIDEHNTAWQDWFASVGVRPHPVRYEYLDADPIGVTRGVLGFLGLELPATREIQVRHKRMADELSAQWIERYRAEMPEISPTPSR